MVYQYWCSVCFKDNSNITIVAGTVICKSCLEKVAEKNRNNDDTLKEDLRKAITKENDIYD